MITESLKKQLQNILSAKFGELKGEVRVAPAPEGVADFAVNIFSLKAVLPSENPVIVADFLKEQFVSPENNNLFVLSSSDKAYLNFSINREKLVETVLDEVNKQKEKIGDNEIKKKENILFEYPSNNTHKELHVGHLRNICLGGSLIKIFEASGAQVVSVNYINDFGAHVAKCLWGMEKFHKDENPPENKQKWLGEIYAEASIYLNDHPEEKSEVAEYQKKLEARDKSIFKLYETTRQWSLAGFKDIFKELQVKHDNVFYEKDIKEKGQRIVDEILKKGIAKIGEGGAIIVDLKKDNLDVALLRKSDGSGLYMTGDLALAMEKNKKYPKVTESINITGFEQNFYFKQLFKILSLNDFDYRMTHIGYGLVTRPEGKMSSRLGNVLLYEDLRDEVYEKLVGETASRHTDWSEDKIQKTAKILALAAIKFEFLKHEANKEIVFDVSHAASFDGFTGPYVLYTAARINSLLKKGKKLMNKKVVQSLLVEDEAKTILLLVDDISNMIKKSLETYNPSVLVKYAFDLSHAFNDFYAKYPIVKPENQDVSAARLALCQAVLIALQKTMSLLVIDMVEEM